MTKPHNSDTYYSVVPLLEAMSFPWAIIAPTGCIRFLQGREEFIYDTNGGLLYPREPKINPDITIKWIQDTWTRYQDYPGYILLQGDVEPYYSLFDRESQKLYPYQNKILGFGFTPLSFEVTQPMLTKGSSFSEDFTPPL